jgi:hypothetical protein
MKVLLPATAVVIVIALGIAAVVLSETDATGPVRSVPAQQPAREPYRPPVWVTNPEGQRCIRQAGTVTCG